MTTEQQLREKLRKISALFEGATTPGERNAAAAALERIRKALAAQVVEKSVVTRFTLPDPWKRRLFCALCRRYGLRPYRRRRQRASTVMVDAPATFVDRTLWPEYLQLEHALDEYLNLATERIIREEVYGDVNEPAERAG